MSVVSASCNIDALSYFLGNKKCGKCSGIALFFGLFEKTASQCDYDL